MTQPTILVSNDDGIHAQGIRALISVAREYANVVVVAPSGPQSGKSCAITIEQPLRLQKIHEEHGLTEYSCNGTPVDCVKLAINQLFDTPPDLLVSGINHGTNAAVSIHYSGTLGAAIEGAFHHIPSIGFSLDEYKDPNFDHCKSYVGKIIEKTLSNGLPQGTLLNVNFPKGELKGIRACQQGVGYWDEEFKKNTDPRGREYFWITGKYKDLEPENIKADTYAMEQGYGAIVPAKVDMTNYDVLETIEAWKL